MAKQVQMTHPTLPDQDPVDIDRDVYDAVWKPVGWKIVKPATKKES